MCDLETKVQNKEKLYADLNGCLMFKYDLETISPLIITSYTFYENNVYFGHAHRDIDSAINILTKSQMKHFHILIDFLADSNYSLKNYEAVHIVGSSNEKNIYYVQINNADFLKQNITEQYHIYLDYKPELFDKTKTGIFVKNTNSNILFGVLNGLTFANCFVYIILYSIYKNPGYLEKLLEHPFKSSWSIVSQGSFYSLIGSIISNWAFPYSNLIFIGLMSYINFDMYKTIVRN
jgi:hypothetical protein